MKSPFPPRSVSWLLFLFVLVPGVRPALASYEAEMAAFAAQDAANPPPSNVIVFTGSSSIVNWTGLKAAFPGYPVLNRGFGGSQMNDVLDHFTEVVTPYHAPLIVLYEGDNDIAAGETPAAVFAEYVSFVDRVDAELPGTDIIIIAVKPSPSRVGVMPAMASLNTLLRDLCASRSNLRFADVFTPMLNASGQPRPELFGSDMLHMNATGYAIWQQVVAPLLADAPFDSADSWRIDFGPSSQVVAPGWNNVGVEIGTDPAGVLTGLVSTGGEAGTVNLEMQSAFNASNDQGTQAAALFPANATRDSLFGNTEDFGGKSNVLPRFRLTGLNPALVYRLTFYASRTGVTDNRQTLYTVAGATTATTLLNASENVNGVAIVDAIAPDAQHGITISLTAGPANNSPNHFTYLGVLKIDGGAPPPADTAAPVLLSGIARSGTVMELTFNEPLDPAFATDPAFFTINGGAATVSNATLQTGGRTVSLTLSGSVSGAVNVGVGGVRDAAGNVIAAGAATVINVPVFEAAVLLFDFGAAATAMEAADDPTRTWNNITTVATTSNGSVPTLVTAGNQPTTAGFQMLSRFNGVNSNGTTASTVFPRDATSDSMFGNTELFNGLANTTPAFKLTGLAVGQAYHFVFYASRTGTSDNRETRYTLTGATTVVTHLQVANNINAVAESPAVRPNAAGEISISLAPGANNNNSNHFTYLGVMKVSPAPPLDLLPPQMINGRIHLQWTGTGQLEHADSPVGPWSAIVPAPQSPWSEDPAPSKRRFYRLREAQP